MSRSPYIDNVVLTNKHSGKRTHKVQAFVIHHMAAKWTGKRCAEYFRDTPSRQASANYCIGYDGDVALNVEEGNRAWTSSSNWADQRALTYELSNSKTGHPWEVSDKTINKLIVMLAEQHKRYGLKKASYTGDTNGTLWRHDWFASTNCPGPYLGGKLSYIADEVNKILSGEEKVTVSDKKPVATVAQEVLAGKWGNGDERKRRLQAAGYDYNSVQNEVNKRAGAPSQPSKPKLKSVTEIAKEVNAGKWGNNPQRKQKLQDAGYNYQAVQAEVNKLAGQPSKPSKPKLKSVTEIAKEVNAGKWGNNPQRKQRLQAAGYNYDAVQKEVNRLAGATKSNKKSNETIAKEVLAGKWSNGAERKRRLEAAGYNFNTIQTIVNRLA